MDFKVEINRYLQRLDSMREEESEPHVYLIFKHGQTIAQVTGPGALAAAFRLLGHPGDETGIGYDRTLAKLAPGRAFLEATVYAINTPGLRGGLPDGSSIIYRGSAGYPCE